MAVNKRINWLGLGAAILGLLLLFMLVLELKDGKLYGSKSDGINLETHPVVFYVSILLQAFCVLLLLSTGIALLRKT